MTDRFPLVLGSQDLVLAPRMSLLPLGPASAESLVDDMLGHPDGAAELARWLGADSVDKLRAHAIELLASGMWRALELEQPREPGIPVLPVDPAGPDVPVGPVKPRPRATWIAITVLDENGNGFAGSRWTLTTPDAGDRSILLDEASSWRADDLREDGTCHLRAGSEFPLPDARVPGFAGIRPDDTWLDPVPGASARLVTARAHTVIVPRERTEILLLDDEGQPAADQLCEVLLGGRRQSRRTDAKGRIVVWCCRRSACA